MYFQVEWEISFYYEKPSVKIYFSSVEKISAIS